MPVFGGGRFLEAEIEDWHVECWVWLLTHGHTGQLVGFRDAQLILPTPAFFPPTETSGHKRAQYIFQIVRKLCDMDDWPVRLVAQAELPGRVAELAHVQHSGTCAGTFSMKDNRGFITYEPSLLCQPMNLIATFAHELGHYLNGGFPVPPPDGWGVIEPATDVTSTFLGFGLFGANTAFEFSQFSETGSQGWRSHRSGYLTEAQWLFDLAIFCQLTQTNIADAKPYLKGHLWSQLKKAKRSVEKRDIVSRIEQHFV